MFSWTGWESEMEPEPRLIERFPHHPSARLPAPVARQELFLAHGQCRVHVPPCAMTGAALVDLIDQLVNQPAAGAKSQNQSSFGGPDILLRCDAAIFFKERGIPL